MRSLRPTSAAVRLLQRRGAASTSATKPKRRDLKDSAKAQTAYAHHIDPRLLENNLKWRESKLAQDPNFFSRLKGGQTPQYLWIGCADSRVPQNEIIGAEAGDLFVHRNIGNLALNNDLNCMSVLQYAVTHLHVSHIIVCGHYDCGAVRAAMSRNADVMPPLDNWLRNIRDVYRIHMKELDDIEDFEDRLKRLVELNVIESCLNLFKTRAVQARRIVTHVKQGLPHALPQIHACVYDHSTGVLKELPINWKQHLHEMKHIYQLFDKSNPVDLDRLGITISGARSSLRLPGAELNDGEEGEEEESEQLGGIGTVGGS